MDNGVGYVFSPHPAEISCLAVLVVEDVWRESGTGGASLPLSKNLGALELDDGRRELSG